MDFAQQNKERKRSAPLLANIMFFAFLCTGIILIPLASIITALPLIGLSFFVSMLYIYIS